MQKSCIYDVNSFFINNNISIRDYMFESLREWVKLRFESDVQSFTLIDGNISLKDNQKHDIHDSLLFYFRKFLSFWLKYEKWNKIPKNKKDLYKFFNSLVWLKDNDLVDINKLLDPVANFWERYKYSMALEPFNATKKIYSYNPYFSYEHFLNLALPEKLALMYEYKLAAWVLKNSWGSCHSWTLIYADLLDELWIKYKIILNWVHSFLVFNFKWEWYWFNTNHSVKFYPQKFSVWESIDIWNWDYAEIINIYPQFVVKVNWIEKKLHIFRKKERFVNYIDNMQKDYILVEYNDYHIEWEEKLKRTINRCYIYILNWKLIIELEFNWKKKVIKYKNHKLIRYIKKQEEKWFSFTTYGLLLQIFKFTKFPSLEKENFIQSLRKVIDPSALKDIILNNKDTKEKVNFH